MDIKLKLLLLLSLAVSTGQPSSDILNSYTVRLLSLKEDLMAFVIYTVGFPNYDAYFIAPALMALSYKELFEDGFLHFFEKDFRLNVHVPDFLFSETETRKQFAKRFFHCIANAEKVPSHIREKAAKYAGHFQMRPFDVEVRGFIKPCPLYSFVRAITLIEQMLYFPDVDVYSSVEAIIKFLLTEFNPLDYHIKDTAHVRDIGILIMHIVSSFDDITLTDGSKAFPCNIELFKRLATEETVPQSVKDAIAQILPLMVDKPNKPYDGFLHDKSIQLMV